MLNSPLVFFIPTEKEVEKVLNTNQYKTYKNIKYTIYKNIPFVITGIGKTASAFTSALFYSQFSPKISILTGICGAYISSGINIGDIVSIKEDYFIDEANLYSDKLITLHEKGFSSFPDNKGCFLEDNDYNVVISNTVSLIPSWDHISNMYQAKSNAHVENMEGAAFGAAANKFNIKPYQIRSISNFCGNSENQKWNINLACSNLQTAIDNIIDKY